MLEKWGHPNILRFLSQTEIVSAVTQLCHIVSIQQFILLLIIILPKSVIYVITRDSELLHQLCSDLLRNIHFWHHNSYHNSGDSVLL